jgi:CheY-like chemotaxis protein
MPLTIKVMRQILIIDDEDDIREVAALSLEATAGWEIITACSGAAGILAAANPGRRPHAILMDVMMPGMDGPTTFRQMQQNPDIAGIPVLLLTAKVQGVDQRRFADLGVAGVLFKPFDPLTLAAQISAALGWKD